MGMEPLSEKPIVADTYPHEDIEQALLRAAIRPTPALTGLQLQRGGERFNAPPSVGEIMTPQTGYRRYGRFDPSFQIAQQQITPGPGKAGIAGVAALKEALPRWFYEYLAKHPKTVRVTEDPSLIGKSGATGLGLLEQFIAKGRHAGARAVQQTWSPIYQQMIKEADPFDVLMRLAPKRKRLPFTEEHEAGHTIELWRDPKSFGYPSSAKIARLQERSLVNPRESVGENAIQALAERLAGIRPIRRRKR